jgi:hypothetical protein
MVSRSVTFWPGWTVESSKQGHHAVGGDGVHSGAGPRVEAGESDGHQVGEFDDVVTGDLAECAGRVDYTSLAFDWCVVAVALGGFGGGQRAGQLPQGLVFAGGDVGQPAAHEVRIGVHDRHGLVELALSVVTSINAWGVDVLASAAGA